MEEILDSSENNSIEQERENQQPENFELFRQRQISEASTDVVGAITEIAPQFSKDGKINYYICGSLVQNILPNVLKIQTFQQTQDGDMVSESEELSLTDEARSLFLSGVRKKGDDFDIVVINYSPEDSAKDNGFPFLNFETIKEKCSDGGSLSIIQDEPRFAKPSFDVLSDEQAGEDGFGDYYYSIATLRDGNKIAIASPGALVGGKAFELLHIRNKIANNQRVKEGKLEKDEKDLGAICRGFACIYRIDDLIDEAVATMRSRTSNKSGNSED